MQISDNIVEYEVEITKTRGDRKPPKPVVGDYPLGGASSFLFTVTVGVTLTCMSNCRSNSDVHE